MNATKPKVTATLIQGDCRVAIPKLQGEFDLCIADPPFNIGHGYNGYDDNLGDEEYEEFTRRWLCEAYRALEQGGILAVHCPDSVAVLVLRLAYDRCWKRLDWVNWHYRFGQAKKPSNAKSYINSREHLLVFAGEGASPTFNPHLTPSDRATKYNDKRTKKASVPGMRVAFNIWGLPEDGPGWGRVQGNNKERVPDCPNQLPERYVARIIESYSNPGDRVLVPFGGSGTEMVVARHLGRSVVGIELSEANCEQIRKRLKRGAVSLC